MLDFLSILFLSFPKEQSSELDAPVIHGVDLAQGAQLLRRGGRRLLDGKIADGEAGVSRHFLNRGGRVNGFQNQLAFVHGEDAQRGDNVGYVTPRGDEIHLSGEGALIVLGAPDDRAPCRRNEHRAARAAREANLGLVVSPMTEALT